MRAHSATRGSGMMCYDRYQTIKTESFFIPSTKLLQHQSATEGGDDIRFPRVLLTITSYLFLFWEKMAFFSCSRLQVTVVETTFLNAKLCQPPFFFSWHWMQFHIVHLNYVTIFLYYKHNDIWVKTNTKKKLRTNLLP